MKWLNFNKLTFCILLLFLSITSVYGRDNIIQADTLYIRDTIYLKHLPAKGYEKKIQRIESHWQKLIPKYSKMQFAGSMGLISAGIGWNYGKNKQWETDLLFGIVPRYSTSNNKLTMTVKQNFIPWTVRLNDRFELKPFSTGLYLNTVFDDDFWGREPGKYPNNYYKFSTKFRFNIFAGQGWVYKLNTSKKVICESITFFYEVSTNELYLMSAIPNRYIKAKDILGLSLGIKMQLL